MKKYLAEGVGTMFLVLLACGCRRSLPVLAFQYWWC